MFVWWKLRFDYSHVWMWELDHQEGWALKNWCLWIVMLEKTLESLLDCKKIKPVNLKGNQSWIFTGETDAEAKDPILWPPDTKRWLTGKDPDAGKDWGQNEKRVTEDGMVGGQRMGWLDGITDSMNVNFSKVQETVEDTGVWHAAVKSRTRLSDWTTTTQSLALTVAFMRSPIIFFCYG